MRYMTRASALPLCGATTPVIKIVLLLLAGCSNDTGAAGTATPGVGMPDPCGLVTEADALQALNAPISDTDRPIEANSEYLATCRYVAPRGAGVAVMTVMVHGPESGRAGFRSLREQPFEIEDVAGVGDGAFWIGDKLGTLYVIHGGVFFSIGGDLALDQAKTLALKAIDRLR